MQVTSSATQEPCSGHSRDRQCARSWWQGSDKEDLEHTGSTKAPDPPTPSVLETVHAPSSTWKMSRHGKPEIGKKLHWLNHSPTIQSSICLGSLVKRGASSICKPLMTKGQAGYLQSWMASLTADEKEKTCNSCVTFCWRGRSAAKMMLLLDNTPFCVFVTHQLQITSSRASDLQEPSFFPDGT